MFADLRLALRQLAKSPGFAAVALLTLALGIGANTSAFSVLNALLLHAAPYSDPDSLVRVYRTSPRGDSGAHSGEQLSWRRGPAETGNRSGAGAGSPGRTVREAGAGLSRVEYRIGRPGAAAGLAGVWAVARLLPAISPEFAGHSPGLAAGVTVLLVAAALLACWLPVRRAAKVDPLTALRSD